jgi:hypothetical protein
MRVHGKRYPVVKRMPGDKEKGAKKKGYKFS